MPPIYYLNPPPNPFWDFVAGIEDHPFFAQHRRPVPPTPPPYPARPGQEQPQAQTQAAASSAAGEASERAKGKQPATNVEDPPEVDPSTVRPDTTNGMPFRGRGRFCKSFDGDTAAAGAYADKGKDKPKDDDHCHRGRHHNHHHQPHHPHGHGPWGRGGHHGGPPFGGPPPFMFGPHGAPWFARPGGPPAPPGQSGPEGHAPCGGRGGRGGRGRHGGPHHGHHHHRQGSGPHSPPAGFDLARFLNNLGERLGVDLAGAAEGLGLDLDRFRSTRAGDADFEPRTDIFDTAAHYTVHLSLPGAKKSDVGVDWDGEHSTLRVAGVVHRPNVDEDMMARLVVDGRKREIGVFEKSIRLGTAKEPASIDVAAITAKMVDGVLVVRVPKLEKTFEKTEVRVDGSPSPERPEDAYLDEKDLLFDAAEEDGDENMDDAPTGQPAPTATTSAAPPVPAKASFAAKEKQREADADIQDDRSETVGREHPDETVETLPVYEETHRPADEDMSDWEKAGSEDEGDYVKINVD